jgi:hypothetical protein
MCCYKLQLEYLRNILKPLKLLLSQRKNIKTELFPAGKTLKLRLENLKEKPHVLLIRNHLIRGSCV